MSNFYFRPNRFPPVVKNLLIVNVLIFIAQETVGTSRPFFIENLFALHDVQSVFFKPHQLVTYMFLHGGFAHILFNMIAVWVFGSMLENHWGSKRFLQFYVLCGIGAGLLHLGVLYFEMQPYWDQLKFYSPEEQKEILHSARTIMNAPTLGASGAVFGCLAGAAYLFPNTILYVNLLFPIKLKWLALIYGGMEIILGVRNSAGDNVAHFAHIGGAITGFIIVLIWNKTNRKTFY